MEIRAAGSVKIVSGQGVIAILLMAQIYTFPMS